MASFIDSNFLDNERATITNTNLPSCNEDNSYKANDEHDFALYIPTPIRKKESYESPPIPISLSPSLSSTARRSQYHLRQPSPPPYTLSQKQNNAQYIKFPIHLSPPSNRTNQNYEKQHPEVPSNIILSLSNPHVHSPQLIQTLRPKPEKLFLSNECIGGFLYKRREYFRKQWRRRYFVLDKKSGFLNYYSVESNGGSDNSSFSFTQAGISSLLGITGKSVSDIIAGGSSFHSKSKAPSEKSLDTQAQHEMITSLPSRGTLYLPGCTVYPDPLLSNPSRKFFAFTIFTAPTATSHQTSVEKEPPMIYEEDMPNTIDQSAIGGVSGGTFHLSARSEEERKSWIRAISDLS
eukprot:CAMPEP_0194375324 /NCGR_PEP_ID=MMETSP0174-20130528/23809_1 /TAXON_ID=216777 /ORGANISM="Proboscia alata, Strain PI-D3" /LENGTH=348 /DNA_ID=CAMNT_0039155437 /DNA_START=115 /DNA_END=1158 /DNA_ORIENTATION=+